MPKTNTFLLVVAEMCIQMDAQTHRWTHKTKYYIPSQLVKEQVVNNYIIFMLLFLIGDYQTRGIISNHHYFSSEYHPSNHDDD